MIVSPKGLALVLSLALLSVGGLQLSAADRVEQAAANGRVANEGLRRCRDYVQGWLELADPETGLIPRNRRDRYWNAKDAAADNYPFMVLASSFVDQGLFAGRMREMLATERRLTARLGVLPDTWSFKKNGFKFNKPETERIIFGASEYVKDGLLPLTEWLGASPWSERMIELVGGIWQHAPVEAAAGVIPSNDVEVNGELLQTLARLYWMTADERYLDWALRLGDTYLLGDRHPTRDMDKLRLRDHGCEIVSGLTELYATVHHARPDKKAAYQSAVHGMLDRILAVGRNEHGLFYDVIDPVAGRVLEDGVADTWGYTFNAFYTVYLIDGIERYREATRDALAALAPHYRNFAWERDSSDGYADAIESALNLFNREPDPTVADWMDSEIHVMWDKQQPSGVIEGWHGDGNFTRTTIMYCLWKSQGISLQPWREDLIAGAVADGDGILLALEAAADWEGELICDRPRHRDIMRLPLDWPRINQFPEWFTVTADQTYQVAGLVAAEPQAVAGERLREGLPLRLTGGERLVLRIAP